MPPPPIVSTLYYARLHREYDPERKPIACGNCRHAVVFGDPAAPEVRCAQGWGDGPAPLYRLIRARALGFRKALGCEDFTSMSDSAC